MDARCWTRNKNSEYIEDVNIWWLHNKLWILSPLPTKARSKRTSFFTRKLLPVNRATFILILGIVEGEWLPKSLCLPIEFHPKWDRMGQLPWTAGSDHSVFDVWKERVKTEPSKTFPWRHFWDLSHSPVTVVNYQTCAQIYLFCWTWFCIAGKPIERHQQSRCTKSLTLIFFTQRR